MDLLEGVKRVHFIGIGGSGMFPIVEILHKKGYIVTGSDSNESDIVRLARKLNIKVFMKQEAHNIIGADLIIYTSAILENNEELVAAKKSNIKTIERNEFLKYFTEKFDNCICVCGTHGKTTTTSIITQVLLEGEKDPSAIIGGKLEAINGYSRLGKSSILVCEACEFQDHFLNLFPDVVVFLNVDNDHLDYFKNMVNLKKSFRKFCEKATKYIVYNGDDENVKEVVSGLEKRKISFGFNSDNDYYACNIVKKAGVKTQFDIYKNKTPLIKNVEISIPGMHNILNTVAAVVVAVENCVLEKDILNGVKSFKGAGRRFELVGVVNGVTVLDDYAHHPNEILATLKALKDCDFEKIWVIHQPFTYSRTILLKEEFKEALKLADCVIITEILGSREENKKGISGQDLADIIPKAIYIKEQEDAKAYVLNNAKKGDVIITMGCGDIYKCARMIVFGKY